MNKIHYPTTSIGMAFNMPLPDAISRVKKSVRELDKAVERTPGKREGFGSRITAAVKRKLATRQPPHISADVKGESFGEKLKKAVKRKAAQREKSRWRKVPVPPDQL